MTLQNMSERACCETDQLTHKKLVAMHIAVPPLAEPFYNFTV